jgi:hypothetical protein
MILTHPQTSFYNSYKDINLFLAGVGSGKSHLAGVKSYSFIKHFPDVYGFVGANTYDQLNTSTLKRIRDVWLSFGIKEDIHYVVGKKPPDNFANIEKHNFDSYSNIITFVNGAVVFKGSLDNYKAHDGKEFGWAILDETKDTKEEAVKDVILARLRQRGLIISGKEINPLYIVTSPAKVDWLNEWFFLDKYIEEIQKAIYGEDDFFLLEDEYKHITISSTYHNIDNLPAGYIEKQIRENPSRKDALVFANPFTRHGGEFYSSFDRQKHVTKTSYNPELALHISFDQNVVPYITCKVYQIERVGDVMEERHIDEICLSSPRNNTGALCEEFLSKYPKPAGLFYYGDPSGKNRDTRGQENDYDIIRNKLRLHLNNASDRVPGKHPSVQKRRDFTNNIFDEVFNIRVKIDPKCCNTINDYLYLKVDVNGKKLKEVVKDKNTGQSYEKYGHCSDADDYFRTQIYDNLYNK